MNKLRRRIIQSTAGFGLLAGSGILLRAQTASTQSNSKQHANTGDGENNSGDHSMSDQGDSQQLSSDWREFAPDNAELPAASDTLELDNAVWRERLDADAYRVLRKESTERAFTSPLLNEHRRGLFVCAGCDLPLFTSAMKFDSGTGWPSFTTVIDGHIDTKHDYRLFTPRTEYHCARCGGHQGHVFDDGPPPTGQRWCNNGVALKFLAAD